MINVLFLDDQQSVLEGIAAGIEWGRPDIGQVFFSSSPEEAKAIFSREQIHVFFCDIEMPGQNGIDVVKWVTRYSPQTINIFLTSHAEFTYARSAVSLGAFEYILQPASYEEISAVLDRAVEEIRLKERQTQLREWGSYMEKRRSMLAESLCSELLHGRISDYAMFFSDLSAMGYQFRPDMSFFPVLFHLLDDRILAKHTAAECQWAVESMLQEILNQAEKCDALLYSDSWSGYYLVLPETPALSAEVRSKNILSSLSELLNIPVACYTMGSSVMQEIPALTNRLMEARRNNVLLKPGYFDETALEELASRHISLTDQTINRWQEALERDMVGIVRREIDQYLKQLELSGDISFTSLLELHQKFTQIFLHVLAVKKLKLSDIFTSDFRYTDYNEGYQTLAELRKTIEFALNTLSRVQPGEKPELSYVDQTKKIILEHISENLQVQELAGQIGLSPDYLSRLFKRMTGQTIKDYILGAKVDTAKQMLETTSLNVSEIASRLGYDNVSHFDQIFKRFTGQSPSKYKQKT